MDRDTILEALAKVLDDETFAQAKAELDTMEIAESHWLAQVLQAALTVPMPQVPPVVTQDLKSLMRDDDLIAAFDAHLVADSRANAQLVGVRGADQSEGWSLSFTSEVADLVIDIWPDSTGRLSVEGQVMAYGAAESAYRAAVSGPQDAAADGDRLGRFELGALEPGSYNLKVGNGRIELSAILNLEEPPL